METLAEVYGDDRWGRAYGYKDPIYSGGWHRGQDIRKQVPSGAYSISHDVLALNSGKVVNVTRKTKVGLTIVIDRGTGPARYEFHSHLRNAKVKVGDRVKPGQKLAETALAHENPGTSWGGPHDHVVFSDYSDASWNTNRTVIDPRPIIRGARKPVTPPKPAPSTGGGKGDVPVTTRKRNDVSILIVKVVGSKPTRYGLQSEVGIFRNFTGEAAARAYEQQIGGAAAPVGKSYFDAEVKRANDALSVTVTNLIDAEK